MDYLVKDVNESNSGELIERLISEDAYVGRDHRDVLRFLRGREGFSYESCQGEEKIGEFIEKFFEGLYAKKQVMSSTHYILLVEFNELCPVLMSDLAAIGKWLFRIADFDDEEEHVGRIISRNSKIEEMRMLLVCLKDVKGE